MTGTDNVESTKEKDQTITSYTGATLEIQDDDSSGLADKSSPVQPKVQEPSVDKDTQPSVTVSKNSLRTKCDSSRNLYEERSMSNRQKRQTSTLSLMTDVKSAASPADTRNLSGSSELNYFYNLTF